MPRNGGRSSRSLGSSPSEPPFGLPLRVPSAAGRSLGLVEDGRRTEARGPCCGPCGAADWPGGPMSAYRYQYLPRAQGRLGQLSARSGLRLFTGRGARGRSRRLRGVSCPCDRDARLRAWRGKTQTVRQATHRAVHHGTETAPGNWAAPDFSPPARASAANGALLAAGGGGGGELLLLPKEL